MRCRSALPLVLLAVSSLIGCRSSTASSDEPSVVEVVDGDTVVVRIGDHDETVRLIGVDTPETKHPTKPVQCFGPEASAFAARLLPKGAIVRLERDVEPRDHFGRLLAYVYRANDGLFVNVELARQGYARPLVIAPNDTYAADVDAAAREARTQGRGLWHACPASS